MSHTAAAAAKQALAALIAQLKAANEGDPELERAIMVLAAGAPAEMTSRWIAPNYTTSVDAALTLLSDDWTAWELRSHQRRTRFVCELSRLDDSHEEVFAPGRARTPALAVCIAALEARRA